MLVCNIHNASIMMTFRKQVEDYWNSILYVVDDVISIMESAYWSFNVFSMQEMVFTYSIKHLYFILQSLIVVFSLALCPKSELLRDLYE